MTLQQVENGRRPAKLMRKPGRTVFSGSRTVVAPTVALPPGLTLDTRIRMDGLRFLELVPPEASPAVFFDPQYRGVLDKMAYGNHGENRERARAQLQQMPQDQIVRFLMAIDRVLIPTGHLFLWVDKFHLCEGVKDWFTETRLEIVDLINWNKLKIGMGYRSRRVTEHCLVLQKLPRKAKGAWQIHDIRDTWDERRASRSHTHAKPVGLQCRLIEAVTNPGDMVIDPAAGSFSVMQAAHDAGRRFLGCDIEG